MAKKWGPVRLGNVIQRIRSVFKHALDADLIDKAERLRAVGRAGVGVDNVDVPAATKRGIVVANAPQSNVITAAEHTMAMLLALARNVPQAHASLTSGKWERSKFVGTQLAGKTLGIVGVGRIGREVARRARGLDMTVVALDPFVTAAKAAELGLESAASLDELLGMEGNAARRYFSVFGHLVSAQSDLPPLTARTRRPPDTCGHCR